MHRITTFQSTTDRIYDGGPIIYVIILIGAWGGVVIKALHY
jgi:hypothetical protein